MSPLERAARALALESSRKIGPLADPDFTPEEFADTFWRHFLTDARAAIAAIREPSEPMVSAGAERTTAFAQDGIVRVKAGTSEPEVGARLLFSAMIDALLAEDE